MNKPLKIVMGIESSCDETAVAIVREDKKILSNLILSQLKEHKAFGGVVPEIAARAHMTHIDTLIQSALEDAGITFQDLDAVAATTGPGLIGGVMVGMMAGKIIAATQDIPFVGVNHLEGHALTARLTENVEFPYLVLLVSGGHTQLLIAQGVGQYTRLGTTLDDALGECFDKSAKLMGLPYPGGPNLEAIAQTCKNPQKAIERFPLPTPLKGRKDCNFSFSGLKTAVRNHIEKLPNGNLERDDITDLAYAFETTVVDTLKDRVKNGIHQYLSTCAPDLKNNKKRPTLVVCGGVAANTPIRVMLQDLTHAHEMDFIAPPLSLCSDNGAMIAWVGIERLLIGDVSALDMAARPRWPLDPEAEALRRN